MNCPTSLRVALQFGGLAVPLTLLTSASIADGELTFAARSGAELRKQLVEKSSWELDTLMQKAGGRVVSDEAPPLTSNLERRLRVFDEYGPLLENGDPQSFVRTLEEILVLGDVQAEIDTSTYDFHAEVGSDLVDEPIRFRSDGEGGFDAGFVDPGADRTLLEGLLADMDFLRVLPGSDVEEGDEWELDERGLRSLLCPGGAPKLRVDVLDGDWTFIYPSDILALALSNLGETAQDAGGSATVTWVQTVEEGDRRLALLEIEFEVDARADLSERLEELVDTRSEGEPREDYSLETELTLQGSARLTWDLENGYARSLALESESELTISMAFQQDMQGQSVPFEALYELLGDTSLQLDVTD